MPNQTPSGSEYTSVVRSSALANAAAGNAASGIKPKGANSLPLIGGSAIRALITQSRTAVSSGIQPLTARRNETSGGPKGKSWTWKVSTRLPSAVTGWKRVFVGGASNNYIVAYTDSNIYYSTNGGTSWSNVSLSTRSDIQFQNYAISRNGIWTAVSDTNASYWYNQITIVNLSTGTTYTIPFTSLGTLGPNYGVTGVAIANDGTLYAAKFWNETLKFTFSGSGYGSGTQVHNGNNPQAIVTSDDGTKWYTSGHYYDGTTKTAGGPGSYLTYACNSSLTTLLAGIGNNPLVLSTYNGSSWTNTSISSSSGRSISSVSCSSDAGIITLASASATTTIQGIYISLDGGTVWTRMVNGVANHTCVSPDGTVVFGTLSNGTVYEGVYA